MKKNSLVKTQSGHIFFITEVDSNVNFGIKGQLVVAMWSNNKPVFDISNDDSKKPSKSVSTGSGYLSDWGFEDESIETTEKTLTAASWNHEGKYGYDTDPLDIVAVGSPRQYDRIQLDGYTEESKKTLIYLDYDKEFTGWFKEENYTPKDVQSFEDNRWSKVLNKKTYTDSY